MYMIKTYFLTLFGLASVTVNAQYCTTLGPNSNIDSNVESVNLTGESATAISYIGCPGITGLQDLTNLSATLNAGSAYSINIQFGTCGGNYAGVGEAWIDYNGDQIFDVSESIGTWTGTPPTALSTFNFNVPAGLTNGTTRMRIMHWEAGSLPLDPCGSYSWGSVMDFSINLTGGVDCSAYTGNTTADPIIVNTIPYTNNHDNSFCYSNDNPAYISPDVFYLVIPDAQTQAIKVSLCGSSFDTFLSVFDTDGNTITFNDDGSCGAQSEVAFSTVGLDSVYVVVEGWGAESGTYTINITESTLGLNENKNINWNIYPNPTASNFKISTIQNSTLSIYDISGKLVRTINNYKGEDISINDIENGVYFVNFNNSTQKLIVRK